MWRIMHECHQAQALISQQLSNLSDNHNTILNSEYHHQATIQFETEASYWYNSFCKLVKSQREYVRTLCRWIEHTNCLREGQESGNHSSIHTICKQWELRLDGLPDKVLFAQNLMSLFFLPVCFGDFSEGKSRNSFSSTVLLFYFMSFFLTPRNRILFFCKIQNC